VSSERSRASSSSAAPAAALTYVFAAGALLACGAEGTPAPHVPATTAPSACPSTDEALGATTSMLEGSAQSRALVGRVLGEGGGIKVLVQALFALADFAPDATFTAVRALPPQEGLGALGTHLVEVLHYMEGSGRYSARHDEPLASMHEIARTCDAATTWRALSGLLALDVVTQPDGTLALAPYGTGERAWLGALLDVAQQALDEPEFEEALARFELEDDEAGPGEDAIVVGRAAFQLLFHIVAANLAAPDFDPGYTRQLINDALLVLVDGAVAREAADRMLDVLFLPMDPSSAVFLDTQALVGCVDDADEPRALAGMVFDWMTVEELSPGSFLEDVASQSSSDAAGALRPVAIDLFAALASRPSLAADTARVAGAFLSSENGLATVRLVIDLKGRGVVAELLSLFDEISSCR
jgi:hypothetical protein